MQLKIGESYSGFKLLEEGNIDEIKSTWRLFQHIKSGARLLHIENKDDNKVFSVSFRTPPKDSTGVAHILEHSVLCGSEKFPVKEPFVELLKGSLNTFLNAFTFPDKTMYPVASRNSKDFLNLMDVYLDSVFHPNIYKYPEIMMQEGWHYEINNKDEEITYKGVVYNEMKGAFSSPESLLMRKVSESLFPDNTYGVESGGDPDHIPDLTQEKFLKFHSEYYHPSNSYMYLYGDMNILENLKFIDDNYLKNYDMINVDSSIHLQSPFDSQRRIEVEYPISNNEKEVDKTFFSLNYVISNSEDDETYLAFEILEYLLLESPAAPLKKAIIDANLGRDVFGVYDSNILQPALSIVVKNSNIDREDEFKKVVYDTLNGLVKNGIDKKLIESAINIKEFELREADFSGYPKGLMYNILCTDTWLYEGNPVSHLKYDSALNKIKKALTSNYFEDLIKKYIISNTHSSLLVVKPKKGLGEEKGKQVAEKLANFKKSLNVEQLDELIKETQKLKERQTSGDSTEDLKKVPMLSLEDIEVKADKLPIEEKEISGIKTLFHNEFSNGICYLNLYFDTSCIKQELVPYFALLGEILGNIDTANYKYEELSNEINIHTGGIKFNARAYMKNGSDKEFTPKYIAKAKSLVPKLPKLIEIMKEVMTNTKFDNKKRIREIIGEIKSRYEMKLYSEGNSIAASRVMSYFSPYGSYNEELSGLSFYEFISELDDNFDKRSEEIIKNLKDLYRKIFSKSNLLISVTCTDEEYENFRSAVGILLDNLEQETSRCEPYDFKQQKKNEGLMISGKVQYVVKGGNFITQGYKYTGSLQVLKIAARFDYLWNKVRVQGGAYGCGANFLKNGNMYFSSYRDPNLKETLKIYDEIVDYIKNFSVDEREMTKFIIGTISELDTPLSPSLKGQISTANYICNITQEDIQRERDEVLRTDTEAIRNLENMVIETVDQNYICVVGSEEKIKAEKELFKDVFNVIS